MNSKIPNSLIWSAVPTLFDVPNPPKKIEPKRRAPTKRDITPVSKTITASPLTPPTPSTPLTSSAPSTSSTPTPLTPTKQRLRRDLNRFRCKLWRLKKEKKVSKNKKIDSLINSLSQYLPLETVKFITTQIKMSGRNKKGMRWPIHDKMLALSIYFHSRKAYKLLGKVFNLPSKRTLTRTLQRSNINPGFSEAVFKALKVKVDNMSKQDTQCAIIFDEMAIKQGLVYNSSRDCIEGFEDYGNMGKTKYVANHASVFMVRGLHSKWKQPIGYFLSSGPISASMLKTLTRSCIEKVSSVGLDVRALICDQGSNNRSFLEKGEKVSIEKPFFEVGEKKVFVIYDPPHLLKNIRNNLKKHGFKCGENVIDWKYIEHFYDFDKKLGIRMAPKLKDIHINLPPFSSMRVNLAAQVISHSVAAGISFLTACGQMSKDAIHTAEFLELFDKLFNVFNSSSLKSSQQYSHGLSAGSNHWQFLDHALQYLSDLKLQNGKSVPCLEGWKLSIKSLSLLWHELHSNNGFDFLLTNRLNQDCIENLFSVIRGKGGHRENPNSEQFRAAFRQVVFNQMLIPSEGSNCQADLDRILIDLSNISCPDSNVNVPQNAGNNDSEQCLSHDSIAILKVMTPSNIPEQNVGAYIAGYILHKIPITCIDCKTHFAQDTLPKNDEMFGFLREKTYKEQGCLKYPSSQFASFINDLEFDYAHNFPLIIYMDSVMMRLQNRAVESSNAFLKCEQDTCKTRLQSIVKLFLKIRVHASLKRICGESRFSDPAPGKRNRKVLKLLHI